jgi:outer membrane protein
LGLGVAFGAHRPYARAEEARASSAPVTLETCYRQAVETSETLAISEENIRFVQAQYYEKLGSVLPHVDWIKSQFYQQKITPSSGSGGSTSTSLLATQPLSYFQLTQPLFYGGRDWNAVEAAKSVRHQARYNRDQARLQLLSDVATAFYTAVTVEQELGVLYETRKITADRLEELKHWVQLGRSRPSETLSEESQLATLEAQIEDQKRTIGDARHLLDFLTRVDPETPLEDPRSNFSSLSLKEALDRAGKRPDLLAAEESVRQAQILVQYARGGHWPSLDLTARSYTERIGLLSGVRWDATFLLDVPLFAGGETHAQVLEARSQEIAAQLSLARLRRDIDRQVRTAYEDFTRSRAQSLAYGKAVDLAEKNYAAQKGDYRVGLINNLQLLQVLTDMQNLRRQALDAESGVKLNDVRLRIAMGEGL